MKKILLSLLVAFCATTASAQFYVGGALGVKSVKNGATDVSTTSFTVAPEIGYSFTDRWGVGVCLGYNSVEDNYNEFDFTPYVRYTAVKWHHVNLFLDGFAGINTGHYDTIDRDYSGWGVGLKPGVAVSLSDKCTFAAHLGALSYASESLKDADANTEFKLGVDLTNVTFGFYFNF